MVLFGAILIVLGLLSLMGIICAEKPIFSAIFCILAIVGLLSGCFICVNEREKVIKEHKYPASEYHLDYEVITRGEQVDTVYVLTRK